jgi:hypothetical protein
MPLVERYKASGRQGFGEVAEMAEEVVPGGSLLAYKWRIEKNSRTCRGEMCEYSMKESKEALNLAF